MQSGPDSLKAVLNWFPLSNGSLQRTGKKVVAVAAKGMAEQVYYNGDDGGDADEERIR